MRKAFNVRGAGRERGCAEGHRITHSRFASRGSFLRCGAFRHCVLRRGKAESLGESLGEQPGFKTRAMLLGAGKQGRKWGTHPFFRTHVSKNTMSQKINSPWHATPFPARGSPRGVPW